MRARSVFLFLSIAVLSYPSTASSETMTFAGGCDVGDRVKLAAVGDLIFHTRLLRDAFARQSGFVPFWRPVESVLASADVTYGNLEGPAADGLAAGGRKVRDPGMRVDYRVYGYRLPNLSFNFHPSVIGQLKSTGFDILSTSNNHSLDRGAAGVDRTIKNFEAAGLAHVGTRKLGGEAQRWSTVTERSGAKLAWLACTFSTNGIPDRAGQTLNCYRDTDQVLGEIAAMAKREDIAGVILAPHWGSENVHRPDGSQRRLARAAIEAGAVAVIGAHPHVLQPWEKIVTEDGREGLVIYSLGNFVSNQRQMPQRVGGIALIELALGEAGKAKISAAGYVPTWVEIDRQGIRVTEARANSYALRHAVKYYPPGNRVTAAAPWALPKSCDVAVTRGDVIPAVAAD